MADHYSANNLRLSLVVKWMLVKACRVTGSTLKKTKPDKAWNFSWGAVPTYAPDWSVDEAEALAKAEDITTKPIQRTFMTIPESYTQDKNDEEKKNDSSSSILCAKGTGPRGAEK